MTIIAVPAENKSEPRVALSPEAVKKYLAMGCEVLVQAGAGAPSNFSDEDYKDTGASIAPTSEDVFAKGDFILKVAPPTSKEIGQMKKGARLVAILSPTDHKDLIDEIAKAGIEAYAMDYMPRITRAQSMDVLSSQSNLAGYKAVIDAANEFERAIPMMMTAAGTVAPARVFVMGAGVAGLQAIATAKRLGAIVTATDVRPAAKEQVASLGGKFIAVENDEFKEAETAGGYAKEMSDAYKEEQAALIAKHITTQDIVITTALIPGRPAPKLISTEMVKSMKPGAIVYDMAAERGGNCEKTKPGKTMSVGSVKIMAPLNIAGMLPANASSLYARNLTSFLDVMFGDEGLDIDYEDEVVTGTLLTKDGKVVHERLVEGS